MEPILSRGRTWVVDLAPGAEDNALALEFAALIRRNLERGSAIQGEGTPPALTDFASLRASILMVAQDLAESFTLRFDLGRLTIHDGNIGVPSVTFCGDADALRSLTKVPISKRLRLPRTSPWSEEGRATWVLLGRLFAADFNVYGLVAHPRTVLCLLRLLSDPDAESKEGGAAASDAGSDADREAGADEHDRASPPF